MNATLEKIAALSRQRCLEHGYDIGVVERLASSYLDVWQQQGYVGLTCREALEAPDYLWMSFFTGLKDRAGHPGRPPSPVAHRENSDWMREYDYCFLNVRATALQREQTGSFVQALKLLPMLRTKGLHLAPFLDCNFGNVYCIDSLRTIYPAVQDETLIAEGVSADEQVRFFVDMAHLAGFVIGFDLEPHTSQFSRVVLDNPQHFRWIRLNKARTATVPTSMKAMQKAEHQEKVHGEVREIVGAALAKEGLQKLEDGDADYEAIVRAHQAALNELIARGLWTVPSHTWGGVGLPDFKRYDKKDNYPVFDYRNAEGEDHAGHAFGMLTPFRFYDNLPINEVPDPANPPVINDDVVDYFASIFPTVQERYGFDFVRLDYVDHVFDSVMGAVKTEARDDSSKSAGKGKSGEQTAATSPAASEKATMNSVADLPVSDRCVPLVLQRVIEAARKEKPYIGAMAERMGVDADDYGSIGFDVLLGCDILGPIHSVGLSGTLLFNRELAGLADGNGRIATVPWAVDTHDSGNPLFWTKPVSEVVGSRGMLLRQFVSRFATAGPVCRPKYECIGNQDMSHGLFKANNESCSIEWVGDRDHTRLYHAIEDSYRRFHSLVRNGWHTWWQPEETYCTWCVDTDQGADGWRGRLICFVALERPVESLKEAASDAEPLPVVPSMLIDVNREWDRPVREVFEVLLDGSNYERPIPLINGHAIQSGGLPPRGYRLFLVRG